jgi:hypothetical protein
MRLGNQKEEGIHSAGDVPGCGRKGRHANLLGGRGRYSIAVTPVGCATSSFAACLTDAIVADGEAKVCGIAHRDDLHEKKTDRHPDVRPIRRRVLFAARR